MRASYRTAEEIFRKHEGTLRTSQAKKLGINERTLTEMVAADLLVRESRGIYRLTDLPPLAYPDLVTVALRVPKAVFCLITALSFYELTTQIPHRVHIALPQGVKKPKIDYPPLDVIWISEEPYRAGIEEHILDGLSVQMYNREKTIADCFKFRNKIGLDIALEALKEYMQMPERDINKLIGYAKIDRIKVVMQSYLEALV